MSELGVGNVEPDMSEPELLLPVPYSLSPAP
jgi:hypothetical protein